MKIRTILDQVDLGSMALPEFQRGYVWNRDQVRGLMHSLYRKHPVGSLLVWMTRTESASARGNGELAPGTVKLLLDGQQRITSLYGIIRGNPPKFFDGNAQSFTGLYFNLDDESFEFYAPLKMKDNPLWINVTELMKIGAGEAIKRIVNVPALQGSLTTYINRLNAIDGIKEIDLHIEEVTGEDKTVDVVVDIFNRVNSGGTKLSKGDLALAKICAGWPEAREEMKIRLDKLLAKVATDFLESLLGGVVPESPVVAPVHEQTIPAVAGGVESDEEERIIRDCNEWIVQQGLPEGEYMYELADHTGNPIAILDLAWPNGLQEGYSQPVALLINEGQEVEEAVNRAGYLFFTEADAFHAYVLKEILANSALDSPTP